MVRIRFRRVGSKNQPSFRIVATDKESPRDGRFLENLGNYNPRTEPSTVVVDEARLFHWLQHGAQPSESVRKALNPLGTWERWERFKAGEDLDTLLEEAKASKIDVDPRTRRDDLFSERSVKKSVAKKDKAAEEVVVEEKPAPEEKTEEEPTEVAVEEQEVPEETETPSEPEPEEEEPADVAVEEQEVPEETETPSEPEPEEEEPEEATEEPSEDEETDSDEEETTPAEDDESEVAEEEPEESSEDEEPTDNED